MRIWSIWPRGDESNEAQPEDEAKEASKFSLLFASENASGSSKFPKSSMSSLSSSIFKGGKKSFKKSNLLQWEFDQFALEAMNLMRPSQRTKQKKFRIFRYFLPQKMLPVPQNLQNHRRHRYPHQDLKKIQKIVIKN